jgi:hypothetical protein
LIQPTVSTSGSGTGRLVIAPLDPWVAPDAAAVLARLQALEVCAEALPRWPGAYAAGLEFMRWISFAGCSAFVSFEPESAQDEAFCHLRLRQSHDEGPLFVFGRNTQVPICMDCKTPWQQWIALMPSWSVAQPPFYCQHCGVLLEPWRLNWRRQAGFGRLLLEFWNIFPGEARPLDALLAELEAVSGVPWRYFFA